MWTPRGHLTRRPVFTVHRPDCRVANSAGLCAVGAQARLMSHALRKITANASKCHTTIIFLNQLRMKASDRRAYRMTLHRNARRGNTEVTFHMPACSRTKAHIAAATWRVFFNDELSSCCPRGAGTASSPGFPSYQVTPVPPSSSAWSCWLQVGVIFGNPEITSGGNALKFYASVRLEVRRKETIKGPVGADDIGIRVKAKARTSLRSSGASLSSCDHKLAGWFAHSPVGLG